MKKAYEILAIISSIIGLIYIVLDEPIDCAISLIITLICLEMRNIYKK